MYEALVNEDFKKYFKLLKVACKSWKQPRT